jgi:hypothetical protein
MEISLFKVMPNAHPVRKCNEILQYMFQLSENLLVTFFGSAAFICDLQGRNGG